MMASLGHEVYHYGAEGSEVDCTGHVTVITRAEQERYFGDYDWHRHTFRLKWDPEEPYWKVMNMRAAAEIIARKQRGDFLCLIGGTCQKPIADLVGEADVLTVEYGIGYTGVFAKFRVFESYTHQAAIAGMLSGDPDGRLYDAVIPNSYDLEEFPYCPDKGDHMLFMARLISRKGLQVAIETAHAAGVNLVLAGQGVKELTATKLTTEEGVEIPLGDGIEYAGYADSAKRSDLMGHARCLILPTTFMEPFGGVVVEAALCGTPAVTTDYAVFAETVRQGVTGFRCHTLAQFVEAVKRCPTLDTAKIREIATANYATARVKYMYQTYFEMLSGLWREGWPMLGEGAVPDLKWLEKA
jgi:glycosyltransferase involved in cell wall biosynthesis